MTMGRQTKQATSVKVCLGRDSLDIAIFNLREELLEDGHLIRAFRAGVRVCRVLVK